MFKTFAFVFGVIILCTSKSYSSGQRSVPVDTVILKSEKYKVEVKLKDEGKLGYLIEVNINGKLVEIPRNELKSLKDLSLRSASMNTHTMDGGAIARDKPRSLLIVGVEFGGSVLHGTKENPVMVQSYVKFYFSKGKYTGWESVEPQQDFKNTWKFIDKELGGAIEENGSTQSEDCPIRPQGS